MGQSLHTMFTQKSYVRILLATFLYAGTRAADELTGTIAVYEKAPKAKHWWAKVMFNHTKKDLVGVFNYEILERTGPSSAMCRFWPHNETKSKGPFFFEKVSKYNVRNSPGSFVINPNATTKVTISRW